MKRLLLGSFLAIALLVAVFAFQAISGQLGGTTWTNEPSNGPHEVQQADGRLPVLSIETDGQTVLKDQKIVARLEQYDGGLDAISGGDPSIEADIAFNYRGNSSYTTFDKLGYRVAFLKDGADGVDSAKQDECLLGMAEDSEWVLHGPFLDRSFVRNRVMYGIAREVMDWAPDTRFCELVVDGEYQGIYLAVESVRNSVSRLGMTQFGLISGGTAYLAKRDREGTEANAIETYGNLNGFTQQEVSISYPGESKLTDPQAAWIKNDLARFEEALYGDDFADPERGYAAYIDTESFVDYYLLNEFAMISDASYLSTYFYKDLGENERLKMAVWDFNNAFDNYPWDIKRIDEFLVADSNWFDRLLEDRAFVDAVCRRWEELRAGVLSDDAVRARFEEEFISLGEAVDRNNEVWGYVYSEKLMSENEEDGFVRFEPSSPEEAVEMVVNTALDRLRWMDAHLSDLYARCVN